MNFKFRLIIGIILLIIVFLPILGMVVLRKKTNKKLDELADADPALKQKTRILKSRNQANVKSNSINKLIPLLIIVIVMIIGLYAYNDIVISNGSNSKMFMYVLLVILVLFLIAIKIKYKKTEKNTILNIKSNLEKKYGEITVLPTHSKEIVVGKKTEVGNIRNVYLFSYFIKKYKCNLVCYYQEKLIEVMSTSDSNHYSYVYQRIGTFLDYIYDITESNPNNLNNSLFISELSRTRIMNAKLEDNYLKIKKETVLHGYNNNDADIDTDDVKIFYEKLIEGNGDEE